MKILLLLERTRVVEKQTHPHSLSQHEGSEYLPNWSDPITERTGLRIPKQFQKNKEAPSSPGDPGSDFLVPNYGQSVAYCYPRAPRCTDDGKAPTGLGQSLPPTSSSPTKREPRCGFQIKFRGTLVLSHLPTMLKDEFVPSQFIFHPAPPPQTTEL